MQLHHELKAINSSGSEAALGGERQPFISVSLPSAVIIQPPATKSCWLNDRSRRSSSILGHEARPQNNRQHIRHEETRHSESKWDRRNQTGPDLEPRKPKSTHEPTAGFKSILRIDWSRTIGVRIGLKRWLNSIFWMIIVFFRFSDLWSGATESKSNATVGPVLVFTASNINETRIFGCYGSPESQARKYSFEKPNF